MASVQSIQAIAREIMDDLGGGYSEAVYRNALYWELLRMDASTVMEQSMPIIYRGHFLGVCRSDLVTSQFVIEIKSLKSVLPSVGNQVRKYLKHLREMEPAVQRSGLVINFNPHSETAEFLFFNESDPPA
jgi:GxxExxY protein